MEPEQVSQVNPLIPDGIEKFIPSCVVCRQPVSAKRATGRSKDTCSPECNKVLRKYREFCLRKSRCPACYHPSTPAERLDFIAWRKARGDVRAGRGRPKMSQVEALSKALQESIVLLKTNLRILLDSHCAKNEEGEFLRETLDEDAQTEVNELKTSITRFEKLIDTKPAE